MSSKSRGYRAHHSVIDEQSTESQPPTRSKHSRKPSSTPSSKPRAKSTSSSVPPSSSLKSHQTQFSRPPLPEPRRPPPSLSDRSFLNLDDPPPGNGRRRSTAPIADDSLPRRRHEANTNERNPADSDSYGHQHSPPPNWPPPRKDSLTPLSSDTAPKSAPLPKTPVSPSSMDTLNIAVLGADGVGKSTFIQRALRAPRPPGNNVTTVRLDLDGTSLRATFLEVDTEFLEVEDKLPIRWPKQINGHMVPRIDGVLVLYDVTNKESLRELPPIMNALAIANIPTVIVATKCDSPENLRQVNTDAVSGYFPAAVASFMTSSNVPGSTMDSLQYIIRAALASKRGAENNKNEAAISRRRAASSAAHLDAPDLNGRPVSQQGKHGRASSDLSLLRGTPPPGSDGGYSYRGGAQSRSRIDNPNYGSDATADDGSLTVSSMLRTHGGVRLDGGGPDTFLDVDESDIESYRHSDDIPILQRGDESFSDKPSKMVGVEFDELVDRLLAPRMTRAENNFADIFLCLYRKFASPSQLLSAILARLEPVMKDKSIPDLAMIQTELRIIEVIAKWVSLYPGDFARSATRRKLEDLVLYLAKDPILTPSAQQMRVYLERYIVEDDDTGWAKSDEPDRDSYHGQETRLGGRDGHRGDSMLNDSMTSLHLEDSRGSSSTHGQAQRASAEDAGSNRRPAAQFQFHSLEDYEREANTMMPTATLPLNKIRYHIFLDKDTDDIADEITRIDWIMFSSIRIRDLVRHVSLSTELKEKCRSLKNVNRMISHFNHVARWVSNMILIRDKAKHRAPCLEKFMLIALRLRVLNNYNGLAAVLAGINGTSIHRLAQTRSLVSVEVQRRFARLGLLMGTQKSHFAYRLAWENSPLPRIPFMPLHRRDLVSAEEGSRTFVGPQGDRINWKKFEVLSEVLLPLMKSQGTPYPNLRKDDSSRELILDCKMPIDEEEIYQRSIQVEPASGMGESSKKKFPWLAK